MKGPGYDVSYQGDIPPVGDSCGRNLGTKGWVMTMRVKNWSGRRIGTRIVILVAAMSLDFATERAQAQWGDFWGYGISYTPPSVDFINRQAVDRIANAQTGSMSGSSIYADNPNAYYKKTRDPEFFEKYDIETRKAMEDRVARRPRKPQTTSQPASTARAAPLAPLVPIASFFDKYDQLAWPSDSPTVGDLGPKRVISDKASLVVLGETRQRGVASLATVTEARRKLLDYGQPALAYVSANLTPRVTDTFHLFLLSLYESLQQAANPPKGTPPPAR